MRHAMKWFEHGRSINADSADLVDILKKENVALKKQLRRSQA
jgi:hypothetical protein